MTRRDETPKNPETDDPEPESDAEPKKERVLHTRIPAVLESELKTLAKSLRVPLSNLVRTILEDAVNIADRATGQLEDRLERAAKSVHGERERMRDRVKRPDPLADVLAFQDVTVARATRCAKCETEIAAGERASLAVPAHPGDPQRIVCADCLTKREGD